MLVLSRKVGQSIIIDGCIVITVSDIGGQKVSIGVSAPSDVRVDREEIHNRRCAIVEHQPELACSR